MEASSGVFMALSSPIRLKILKLLKFREMCVCEIMVALELSQSVVSYHLNILESVGLVKGRRRGKWVFYRITDPKLLEVLEKIKKK